MILVNNLVMFRWSYLACFGCSWCVLRYWDDMVWIGLGSYEIVWRISTILVTFGRTRATHTSMYPKCVRCRVYKGCDTSWNTSVWPKLVSYTGRHTDVWSSHTGMWDSHTNVWYNHTTMLGATQARLCHMVMWPLEWKFFHFSWNILNCSNLVPDCS